MKRFWQFSVAISLGLISAQQAAAQYPGYHAHTGPSSYPVQAPYPQYQQFPQQSPFYLTAAQDSAGSVPAGPEAVIPVPVQGAAPSSIQQPLQTAPQYAPVSIAPPPPAGTIVGSPAPHVGHQPHSQHYAAPQPYSIGPYGASANGCTTCEPTAGHQPYFQPTYTGPQAFTAPSPFSAAPGLVAPHANFLGAPAHGRFGVGAFGGFPAAVRPWFFGAGVLIFHRSDDYDRLLSISDTDMPRLRTSDASLGVMPGFEVFGGRYFNCGKNAISFGYWGLFPQSEMVSVTGPMPPGDLRSSIFSMGEFEISDGMPPEYDVYDLYDDAHSHRLRRSSTFHNFEINLLGFAVGGAARNFNIATRSLFGCGSGHCRHGGGFGHGCGSGCGSTGASGCGDPCGQGDCGSCAPPPRFATGPCGYVAPPCGSCLNFSWLAGFRYFQFNDNFEYAAVGLAGMPAIGDTLSYDVHTRNNLAGFQVGGRADICCGSRFVLYGLARTGIFGNRATLDSRLGTEMYEAYEAGMPSTTYNISRSVSQVAFMSELGTGIGYRFSPKWTATAGYRAIFATGVATAVGNVRYQGDTIPRTYINSNDFLLLHGVNLGITYNF